MALFLVVVVDCQQIRETRQTGYSCMRLLHVSMPHLDPFEPIITASSMQGFINVKESFLFNPSWGCWVRSYPIASIKYWPIYNSLIANPIGIWGLFNKLTNQIFIVCSYHALDALSLLYNGHGLLTISFIIWLTGCYVLIILNRNAFLMHTNERVVPVTPKQQANISDITSKRSLFRLTYRSLYSIPT